MQFWNINRQSLKASEYAFWYMDIGKCMMVTVPKCSYNPCNPRTVKLRLRKKTQVWLMFSLCIWGEGPALNTEPKRTENKKPGLSTHGCRGHDLSRTVREELPWKSSILQTEEKVYSATNQELVWASIFSQDQSPDKQRSLWAVGRGLPLVHLQNPKQKNCAYAPHRTGTGSLKLLEMSDALCLHCTVNLCMCSKCSLFRCIRLCLVCTNHRIIES